MPFICNYLFNKRTRGLKSIFHNSRFDIKTPISYFWIFTENLSLFSCLRFQYSAVDIYDRFTFLCYRSPQYKIMTLQGYEVFLQFALTT